MPKNDVARKMKEPSPKLPKDVNDLGKIFVATGFEKLPKVQLIAQSGHTVSSGQSCQHYEHKIWL